jgi:hypothetical protein
MKNNDNIIENIIGYPSGLIFNIYQKDLIKLNTMNLVEFQQDIFEFIYYDNEIDKIIKYLNEIKVDDLCRIGDTNKIGKVKRIIDDFSGELINGINYSKIFNWGEKIYILEFMDKKTGVYTERQIKKINPKNDIFIDSF